MAERNVNIRTADLTLPIYKVIEKPEHMTLEEAMSFHDNDPVAGTEFREMATLFLQMHEIICDLIPGFRGNAPEALRILQGRSQALVDRTHNFTRPIRTHSGRRTNRRGPTLSEHRLNGTYWPVGRDHPHLHRSGERCTVIGYDHDPDRDVAPTFLISFSDGLALHALPEEIDDSVPRTDDLWKPGRQRSQRGRYVWRRAANGHFETSFIFATYPFKVRVVELNAHGPDGGRRFAVCVEAHANGRILARNFSPVANPENSKEIEEALGSVAGTVAARAHELDARDTARRQALGSPEPQMPGKEAWSQ